MEYLSNLYNTISGSSFLMIVLILGLIIIGYAVLKKLFKLAIFAIACIITYFIYIAIIDGPDNLYDKARKDFDSTKKSFNEIVDDANEYVKEKISESFNGLDNSSSPKEKKP